MWATFPPFLVMNMPHYFRFFIMIQEYPLLIPVAAFVFAVLFTWFIVHSRFKIENAHKAKELDWQRQHIQQLQQENTQAQHKIHKLTDSNKILTTNFAVARQQYKHKNTQWQELQTQHKQLQKEFAEQRNQNNQAQAYISELKTLLQHQQQSNEEKLILLNEAKVELSQQFKSLAQDIFQDKSQQFTQLSTGNLHSILNPFHQQLQDFKQKINDVYVNEAKQRASLKTEIENLRLLNSQLNQEAINLTRALKGDNKIQGDWGEMILQKVLQQSGLREGHEFHNQAGYRNHEQRLLKPDVIVHLPHNKDIIIDSKVSLLAYEKYNSAQSEQQQQSALKQHLSAIESHIKALSEKDYAHLDSLNSLDFILMFIPIEPAFALAFQNQEKLFDLAAKHKIIVISPTTLLATLKTIENLWRYEKQNKNAQEIARRAGGLYDKFRGFLEDIEKLGKQLDFTQNSYHDALNKLSQGKGNLISQAQQLLELGIKVKKELPKSLTQQSDMPKSLDF